jgi:hypothetical protein
MKYFQDILCTLDLSPSQDGNFSESLYRTVFLLFHLVTKKTSFSAFYEVSPETEIRKLKEKEGEVCTKAHTVNLEKERHEAWFSIFPLLQARPSDLMNEASQESN